jgi:NAD(P)-dependent dehydrogenase (short-subunit alcohol dehydrogenase family)
MRLIDKVAIVTGSARGIGRAIAVGLARERASIVVTDLDLAGAKSVVREIEASGSKALAVKADVSQAQQVKEMVEAALKEFGKIDILVNNAGGVGELLQGRNYFRESSEENWDFVIGRNLKSVLNCTRAVINLMIEKQSGKIINIASGCGVVGEERLTIYSAAKAGVIGFTKALAKEVGSYGINVNAVSPGITRTPGIEGILKEEGAKVKLPVLGRLGTPEDIANAVVFLASEEANYITGQNLLVCGGLVI